MSADVLRANIVRKLIESQVSISAIVNECSRLRSETLSLENNRGEQRREKSPGS